MKKILVATDGSENSERAIIEAKKYAEWSGAELTILTVVEYLVMRPYTSVEYPVMPDNEDLETVGESVLTNSLKLLNDFKGEVNTKLRRGNAADEIIKEASSGDFDLVIMGSKGLGIFSRTLLGSVSHKVLNNSTKNILIVK